MTTSCRPSDKNSADSIQDQSAGRDYSGTLRFYPRGAEDEPVSIANAQRCIGCRTCEVACAVAHQQAQDVAALSTNHFAPRIRVVKSGDISTAMACRQCEDAPCASVCPQGAIQRDNDVWWVDQRRCIGCKSCMVACPYGAMTVTVMNQQAQALKCDLCHHRAEGPACVAACPTQALRVMVPAELEALCAQKRQRLALA